jgi:hypothetical protein
MGNYRDVNHEDTRTYKIKKTNETNSVGFFDRIVEIIRVLLLPSYLSQ